MAPPSISHLIFVFGSLMYSRSPFSFLRDAVAFTSSVPLFRFPMALFLVCCTDSPARSLWLFHQSRGGICICVAVMPVSVVLVGIGCHCDSSCGVYLMVCDLVAVWACHPLGCCWPFGRAIPSIVVGIGCRCGSAFLLCICRGL